MSFRSLYQDRLLGIVSGLDRIRFLGTERMLSNRGGFKLVLNQLGVLWKDFGNWANETTKRLRTQCENRAHALGIPVEFVRSSRVDKEALARKLAAEKGVAEDGSICLLSAMEMCMAPKVAGNRATKRLELQIVPRKCIFLYSYFDHPRVGFGHVRLQTWAPYSVKICLNGRHWLEKQLQAHGVGYYKTGNGFPWIADVEKAQELLDEQLTTNWPELLTGLAVNMCPNLGSLCAPFESRYYWSADETEFATDLMFRSKADLDALFPKLLAHGMRTSDSHAVLRYLGHRSESTSLGKAPADVYTDCRRRHEGLRIKHWVNGNSIKMYNKEGRLLRVETTINKPRQFKAFRQANDDPTKPCMWQKMRKGVNDLHRRCEVSRQANERYLDTITAVNVHDTLHEVTGAACNRLSKKGRSFRPLNPWNEHDFNLLTFLAKGEWALEGFRNKTLRTWLEPNEQDLSPRERKKLSARATRLIALLRAHGLIRKAPKENRYSLTKKGRTFTHSLLTASALEVQRLAEIAA